MKNKEIYILREEFYHEWAMECGATQLIIATQDINILKNELLKTIENENIENRILSCSIGTNKELSNEELTEYAINNNDFIDIYSSDLDYDNGSNNGSIVVEKMELREK